MNIRPFRFILSLMTLGALLSFASVNSSDGSAKRFNDTPKLFINSGVANIVSQRLNESYKDFYQWFNSCQEIRQLDRSTYRRMARLLNRGTLHITPHDWLEYSNDEQGNTIVAPWAVFRGNSDVDLDNEIPLVLTTQIYGETYQAATYRDEAFKNDWRGFFSLQSTFVKAGPDILVPHFIRYRNSNHLFFDLILFAFNRHQDSNKFQHQVFQACP